MPIRPTLNVAGRAGAQLVRSEKFLFLALRASGDTAPLLRKGT